MRGSNFELVFFKATRMYEDMYIHILYVGISHCTKLFFQVISSRKKKRENVAVALVA